VVPLYYSDSIDGIPHAWVKKMKESIKTTSAAFSARRMVKDYVNKYYPSLLNCAENECSSVPTKYFHSNHPE
jgi:starch phosphorylase